MKPMDSVNSQFSSITEYLNKENMTQGTCQTGAQNVESSRTKTKSRTSPHSNPDDIEEILHEISEILNLQSADNSECTDIGLNDSRSVEEILKDAEKLVGSSPGFTEEEKSISISNETSCSKKSSSAKVKGAASVSFAADVKDCPEPVKSGVDKLKKSKSYTDFEKTKILDTGVKLSRSDFSISKPFIRNISNKKMIKSARKNSEAYELKLSDLETVYEDIPVDVIVENKTTKSPPKKSPENTEIKNIENDKKNVEAQTENVAILPITADVLSEKVAIHEKKEKEKSAGESRLSIAERNRLALLEEEVLSQEELIASYQRENQRLCSDIINAKYKK